MMQTAPRFIPAITKILRRTAAYGALALSCLILVPIPAAADDPVSLVSVMNSSSSALLELDGTLIRSYHGASIPASIAYLLDDESILRPCKVSGGAFNSGGAGGRIQRIDTSDTVIWDFTMASADYQLHHDIEPLPNGNILAIVWESKTQAEAEAMGREGLNGGMWPTWIVELEPVGASDADIVWEWQLWDHLIQDVDAGKPNFGVVADHPELFDINFATVNPAGDWVHMNAIDYDAERDEILICSRSASEIYVIDHSTTTAEAAGHSGGARGHGGDFLYRWGNPQSYDRGDASDQYFSVAHGATWIEAGLPGAGNILVFNNGDRPGGGNDWSSVDEIAPPRTEAGDYLIDAIEPFDPTLPDWSYSDPGSFYSGPTQCGAYRLPDGNTLVCEVENGHMFEVTTAGAIAWEYTHGGNIARAERYYSEDTAAETAPANAAALAAWPNPFNPTITLRFVLLDESGVTLTIHDIRGARVRSLATGEFMGEGAHELVWDGRDNDGRPLGSGIYLAEVAARGVRATERLVLLK